MSNINRTVCLREKCSDNDELIRCFFGVACNWTRTVESAPNLSDSCLLSKFLLKCITVSSAVIMIPHLTAEASISNVKSNFY